MIRQAENFVSLFLQFVNFLRRIIFTLFVRKALEGFSASAVIMTLQKTKSLLSQGALSCASGARQMAALDLGNVRVFSGI